MRQILRKVEWRLRVLLADRNIRSVAEFQQKLKDETGFELHSSHLTRYTKDDPPALSLEFLTAAATTLDADINELFRIRDVPNDGHLTSPRKAARKRYPAKKGTKKEKLERKENPKTSEKTREQIVGPKVMLFPTIEEEPPEDE